MEDMRKNPDFPVYRVVFIVVSFLLGLLDMTLLYKVVHQLMRLGNGPSMLVSFIVATIANFTALTWGWGNGKRLEKHSINKRSIGEFFAWFAIGCMYAAIRTVNIVQNFNTEGFNWTGEIIQIVILAISYIGTGVLIQSSAREIWDADCVSFRKAKRNFDSLHADIADAAADLQESIGILRKYDSNYKSLDDQKKEIEMAIHKSEEAVMADIVAVTVSNNPMISPIAANKVKEQVLEAAGIGTLKKTRKKEEQ